MGRRCSLFAIKPQRIWNLAEQVVDIFDPDGLEHLASIVGSVEQIGHTETSARKTAVCECVDTA